MPNFVEIAETVAEIWRFFDLSKWRRPPWWIFEIGFLTVLTVGRIVSIELRHYAKFRGDWSNRCRDISILDFSRWWQPQSWIFKILHINIRTVKKDELRHCAKFCRNRSNQGGNMSVFDYSIWRPPPSWILCNFKFLTVGTVKKVELHLRAKFRQNRPNRGWNIAFFDFLKMAAVRHLGFVMCVGTTHEVHLVVFITVQNLVGIDAVVLIICTFFDFVSLA